jgi:hypothetical protein
VANIAASGPSDRAAGLRKMDFPAHRTACCIYSAHTALYYIVMRTTCAFTSVLYLLAAPAPA